MKFPSGGCILYLLITTGLVFIRGAAGTGRGPTGRNSTGPTARSIPGFSVEVQNNLRILLFEDYEVVQRPHAFLIVTVGLNLVTINSLDIKDQVLSSSGFFTMEWNDGRLIWPQDSNYSLIHYMFSNQKNMWRPSIFIENSVKDLKVFSDDDWLIRFTSTGDAFWTPGGVFETSCDVDVTYYPLDTQTCSIVLTTWAYSSSEIQLRFRPAPLRINNFSPNGEWVLDETSVYSEIAPVPHDVLEYSRLFFTLKLKRRPLFHILHTILPVLLMASLIVFVFKLPPESGERVGMSLTVLLAYAVYLTLIADNIPKTSLSTSILSTYLTIILMLSTLSVIFTIVVLDIYFNHDDDEEPSSWVQTFTRRFLVKLSMWKGEQCCRRKKINPNYTREHSVASSTIDVEKKDRIVRDMKPTEADEDGEGDVKLYSWKEVALILDRCFMYLFIFLTVVSTVIFLGVLVWQ